ncbi:MAG: malto-oligosyltrehalose trehalohydrolase [Planctomycetes bacterium]|nr:malto-oligosyltrehalose trehalohydrolase [Planctomycetota bacterium]
MERQRESPLAELAWRRLPFGAEVGADGVHVRTWAPGRRSVEVVLEAALAAGPVPLAPEDDAPEEGWFSGWVAEAGPGTRYRLRLDGGLLIPDPASRFQPEGPHGPSQVVDPDAFAWTDAAWQGVGRDGQVLYELHVGTFTPEGTWQAAARELPRLADLGVTVLEVMPVADSPGRFNWGYDGVCLFAPARAYGEPDDLRAFVDAAHRLGLGVLLDVVYNHFGPDGSYLTALTPRWVGATRSEWGDAPNFDGPDSGPVRAFFEANAGYWIDEFHLDGLRLDATQQLFDRSDEHIVAAVTRRVREAAGERWTLVVAENEPQDPRLVRALDQGGLGCDAVWNDDFHHAARVALTGRREAYYSDYRGTPQELVSAVRRGFLFQGQRHAWQGKRRGGPAGDLPPAAFVHYLQNHDQVANALGGARLHALTSPGRLRALTAVLLLGPETPLLFQGQEHAASSPFLFFADHQGALADDVRRGRAEFLAQFPSVTGAKDALDDPCDEATFRRCKLDPRERDLPGHAEVLRLHRDLLRLRREDPVLRAPRRGGVEGAVLGPEAFVLRFDGGEHGDRLLVVNLGADLDLVPAPEPLLAPPSGGRWRVVWSSEDPAHGGGGAAAHDDDRGWRLAAHAAVLLAPAEEGTP